MVVVDEATLLKELAKIRGKKRIVTTNGSFDLLHVAHVRLLEKAKALGDVLVVLINSDSSVKLFKGTKRPIVPQSERAEMLSFLRCVDFVCIFDDDTPLNMLEKIKPSVHVKGGSFIPTRTAEEKKLVEKFGGKLMVFELEDGFSTTNLITSVLEKCK